MPRVKFEYIVSYSSEDPLHPATNLLSTDVSKKKWLCAAGERSCSVVLGVSRALKISSVTIGAHLAALVEVLVGRSETPDEPFKVLVASSVFLNPLECRKPDNRTNDRVRSFHEDALCDTRKEAWDRFRIVCSQPYNRHCQFGLSFVQMTASNDVLLTTETHSDEEDVFRPGDMFKLHLNSQIHTQQSTSSQIRDASRIALSDTPQSPALVKTPIVGKRKHSQSPEPTHRDRQREQLLYANDEVTPHQRIDAVLEKHESAKRANENQYNKKQKTHDNNTNKDNKQTDNNSNKDKQIDAKTNKTNKHIDNNTNKDNKPINKTNIDKPNNDTVKGTRVTKMQSKHKVEKRKLLSDIVFVLSGYENPERSQLRDCALSMGATYSGAWNDQCTHLICAFPNTPKLRSVRALGGDTAICTGDWLRACEAAQRKLPWAWYATEPHRRVQPNDQELAGHHHDSSIEATDNEDTIPAPKHDDAHTKCDNADILCEQEMSNTSLSNVSRDSDIAFVCDERIKGVYVINDDDATTDEDVEETPTATHKQSLPNFLEGYTVFIQKEVSDAGFDARTLRRYVTAYGGQLVQELPMVFDNALLILCTRDGGAHVGHRVRPDWLWRCHGDGAFVDYSHYLIQ